MKEEVEIYTPPIKEQVPLPIEVDNTGFEDIMEGGVIRTKLNEDVIINRIAKELYKNPVSGIRELYNNSVRACQLAEEEYGQTDSLITVTLDLDTRKITIEDNGIGISKERFKKVLRELGTSDNHDSTKVGQFGMGFASYTTLSSALILDTHARNEDQYRMIAKDGMSFQVIGNSTQDNYGTKLEMICHSEIDLTLFIRKLEDMMLFSGVHSIIKKRGFPYENLSHEFHPLTLMEHVLQFHNRDTIIHIDHDDFELVGVIGDLRGSGNIKEVFLLNSPIHASVHNEGFSELFLNIKDERKYPPMPDRDRMREESEKDLNALIYRELEDYFSTLSINNYEEYLMSDRQLEYLWVCQQRPTFIPESMDADRIMELARIHVYPPGDKKGLSSNFFTYLEGHREVVMLKSSHKGIIRKIRDQKMDMFMLRKGLDGEWKREEEIIQEYGILEAKDYLKNNKIKFPTLEREAKEWKLVCYSEGNRYGVNSRNIGEREINRNVIRLDGISVNDFKEMLRECKTNHIFVRDDACLNGKDCRLYSEWKENEVPHLKFLTSYGMKTVKEIAKIVHESKNDSICQICAFNTIGYEKEVSKTNGFRILDMYATLPIKVYDRTIVFDYVPLVNFVNHVDSTHNIVGKILLDMFEECDLSSVRLFSEEGYTNVYSFRLWTPDKKIKFISFVASLKREVEFEHITIERGEHGVNIEGRIIF